MRTKQLRKYFCSMVCLMILSLTVLPGCSKGGNGSNGVLGNKKDELPEDTPWNHGCSAIMETELGWYITGLGEEMRLCYYDKETGNSILLCNKPECEHDGNEKCEATYRNLKVVNACLYEGFIYLLGWEGICNDSLDIEERDIPETEIADHINLSLYRAALDGSAIDKVATVFETDNIQHQRVNRSRRTAGVLGFEHDDTSFMIHKGVAYIPVYLQLGDGSIGLRGSGFYKVNLSTGSVKEIEKYETLQSSAPAYLYGVSNYVYYYRYDAGARRQLWYRYVISEDRVEIADPKFYKTEEQNKIFGKSFQDLGVPAVFTEEREYFLVRTYQEKDAGVLTILAVDAKTQEILPNESFETEIAFNKRKYQFNPRDNGYYSLLLYDGKFLIADVEKAYFYDREGKKVGEIAIPQEKLNWHDAEKQIRLELKTCNEKLYLIYGTKSIGISGGTGYYHRVLSCSLAEIYQGQGKWTEPYRFRGKLTIKEYLLNMKNELIEDFSENFEAYGDKSIEEYIEEYRALIQGSLEKNYPELFGEQEDVK